MKRNISVLMLCFILEACSSPEEIQAKAKQGDKDAQLSLAMMYQAGDGVPHDEGEALKWYRKSAEQGVGQAQDDLGVMYQMGIGVPRDYITAYMWFSIAAAHAHSAQDHAKYSLDTLKLQMTPEQIAEALERARQWQH